MKLIPKIRRLIYNQNLKGYSVLEQISSVRFRLVSLLRREREEGLPLFKNQRAAFFIDINSDIVS